MQAYEISHKKQKWPVHALKLYLKPRIHMRKLRTRSAATTINIVCFGYRTQQDYEMLN